MATGHRSNVLPVQWQSLRNLAEADGCLLSDAVFEQAQALFLDQYQTGRRSPEALTREYLQEEFLLVVDEEGEAPGISENILKRYRAVTGEHPEFSKWFREPYRPAESAGARVLFAARWLCHLIGLRHRTVEIFIDPPHLEGHTFAQVRSLEKFEAPGAFDIPCAGHISGFDGIEKSVEKELAEELGLSLDDLGEFRLLKLYNSYNGGGENCNANHEFRVLFRARLKPDAYERIRFEDGEVAALAVFSVTQLKELASRFPERIASGLSDALVFYI